MLNPHSRQAMKNIRRYILDHFTPEGYDEAPIPLGENGEFTMEQFPHVANFILIVMEREKIRWNYYGRWEMFLDWSQGLPPVLDTGYHYNRSAMVDLAEILDTKPLPKYCVSENYSEFRMDDLIFHELVKGRVECHDAVIRKAFTEWLMEGDEDE